MGMESFYVNIDVDKNIKNIIKQEIEKCKYYKKGLSITGLDDEKEKISIIGSTFSFLPSCCLIYKLLEAIFIDKTDLVINTYKENKKYDFNNKFEFISYMYSIYEEKLDNVHTGLGAFLVNPDEAYKMQRKLYNKYIFKI